MKEQSPKRASTSHTPATLLEQKSRSAHGTADPDINDLLFDDLDLSTDEEDLDDPLQKKELPKKEKPVPRFPSWHHTNVEPIELPRVQKEEEDENLVEIPMDAPPDTPVKEDAPRPDPLSRLRIKRERAGDQRVAEIEWIRKKNGFSAEDIALIFELGYDDELGRMIGYEDLKKLKRDYKRLYGKPSYKHYRTSFGYSGSEAINTATLPSIIKKYLRDRTFLITRTILTAIMAFVLFFLDYPAFSNNLLTPMSTLSPLFPPILSLSLLVLTALFSFKQINAGLRSFLKAAPTPYSVPAVILFLVIAYDITTLLLWDQVLHVNMLTACILLILALCDVLRLTEEMHTLRILATDEEKTVLEPALPRKKKLRRGDKLIKIINDDEGKSFYRVRHATHITGFFRRFNTTESAHLPFQYLLGMSAGFSVIIGFIGALVQPSLSYGLSSFVTALFLSAPTTAMFGFFYPLYRANKVLALRNCVLLGNESVKEFDGRKTVIFDDTDLYSAEKRAEFFVEESVDLRTDLKLAGALFRRIGGTLSGLGKTVGIIGEDPTITFLRISDKGVEALADGKTRILAGSADYLKKSGVTIQKTDVSRTWRRQKNTAVIYIAIDGVMKFTYEVEYTEKLSFLSICSDLSQIGTAVAIESYAPTLNDTFMQTSREPGATPIRVIKPGRYEGDELLSECDTGAVAVGDKHAIVYPLHAAHCVKESKRFGMRLQWFSFSLGILLAAAAAFFPQINILTPLSMALYHGFFVFVFYLVTHLSINRHTLRISRFF